MLQRLDADDEIECRGAVGRCLQGHAREPGGSAVLAGLDLPEMLMNDIRPKNTLAAGFQQRQIRTQPAARIQADPGRAAGQPMPDDPGPVFNRLVGCVR